MLLTATCQSEDYNMNDPNMQEDLAIDLKQLLISICRRWKLILLAVLVGAVLLGGVKLLSDSTEAIEAEIEANEEEIQVLDEELYKIEQDILKKQRELLAAEVSQQEQSRLASQIDDNIKLYEQTLEWLRGKMDSGNPDYEGLSLAIATTNDGLRSLRDQKITVQENMRRFQMQAEQLQEDVDTIQKREKKNMDDLQESIATLQEANAQLEQRNGRAPVSSAVKMAIIGGILGAIAVCGVEFVRFLTTHHLNGSFELKDRYDLRILGSLYCSGHKGGIDRLLDRWAGEPTSVDESREYALAASAIRVEDDGQKPVLVLGTAGLDVTQKVCAGLQSALPELAQRMTSVGNPVYDAPALEKLGGSLVVLAESVQHSDKRELDRLAELVQVSHAQVLGVVLTN